MISSSLKNNNPLYSTFRKTLLQNQQLIESKIGDQDDSFSKYNFTESEQSQSFSRALEENNYLRKQIEDVINRSTNFGNTSNVVMLQLYNSKEQQLAILQEQNMHILRLQERVRMNVGKIEQYKRISKSLRANLKKIQSVDSEIYKILQGSVSREQQLLKNTIVALQRGDSRQQIRKILEQIISTA